VDLSDAPQGESTSADSGDPAGESADNSGAANTGAADMGAADTGADVTVLLPRVSQRVRVVRALEGAGYRVAVRRPPARVPVHRMVKRRSPVLVTDDTDGGTQVRAEVVAAEPETACVVLVDDPTPARYRQLLGAGVTALPTSSADDDVVLAVDAAARALTCLPASAARALAGANEDRPVLSVREASWLRALVSGTTVARLARSAGYSQREMYRLLGGLYRRLGATNRTEALLRADRWGLLATPSTRTAAAGRPRVPAPRGPAQG